MMNQPHQLNLEAMSLQQNNNLLVQNEMSQMQQQQQGDISLMPLNQQFQQPQTHEMNNYQQPLGGIQQQYQQNFNYFQQQPQQQYYYPQNIQQPQNQYYQKQPMVVNAQNNQFNSNNIMMKGQPILNPNQQIVQNGIPLAQNAQGFPTILIPKDAYQKLMIPGVFVKQKVELLEIMTGCETQNVYKVYACDVDGTQVGKSLFKCKEKSSWFQRNCLPGDCRKFGMKVNHESDSSFVNDGQQVLQIDRTFAFTILCFNRPYITINYTENGENRYIGKIQHEFSLCSIIFNVYDDTECLKFIIKGDLFQIGVWASDRCPIKRCQEAYLFIYTVSGEEVGLIEKRGKGLVEFISDADNYALIFPVNASLEDRALLLSATLFMDYRYFESTTSNNNRNSYQF